ncbi:MAG TPA: prepilin-type N-terminal cleavage/methylation domain-containing protein [Desulfosporosinus sp.]|nr:prepilin-type N-terminal cleavage/methylation domain-containing protein [Desulfosporosinus sp.]
MADIRGKDRGYTLLEMLLVLILLSGAGFVLLIKLPINFEQQRLAFATTQLLEEIRDVRQTALAENNWYEVKFYPVYGDHHYKVFRQGTRVKDVHFKDGIQFVGQPGNLIFNASGRSVGTTITLTNPSGERRSVVVAPVGMRIREK